MRKLLLTLLILTLYLCHARAQNTIYSFSIEKINSDEVINLQEFKGKKILFVNVASKCAYTDQYRELQALYEKYSDRLVVIGLPCSEFNQEFKSEKDIEKFCHTKYQITFPVTSKINVSGNEQHPIYQWLTHKSQNGTGDYTVSWNFNKFLVDEEGHLIRYFGTGVKPFDYEIVSLL